MKPIWRLIGVWWPGQSAGEPRTRNVWYVFQSGGPSGPRRVVISNGESWVPQGNRRG